MKLGAELKGLGAAKKMLRGRQEGILNGIEALVAEYTLRIERTAKKLVRVDTGELRDSIRSDLTKAAGRIIGIIRAGGTPEVDYQHYVEYGTYKMAARPYMHPAFQAHWRDFVRDVQRLLETGSLNRVQPA